MLPSTYSTDRIPIGKVKANKDAVFVRGADGRGVREGLRIEFQSHLVSSIGILRDLR